MFPPQESVTDKCDWFRCLLDSEYNDDAAGEFEKGSRDVFVKLMRLLNFNLKNKVDVKGILVKAYGRLSLTW